MAMSDLVEFLRARLAKDARAAEALLGATRMLGGSPDFSGQGGPAAEAFWDRFTPARALAEVEVKRRLITMIVDVAASADGPDNVELSSIVADDLLRLLALPYADDPAYEEGWRP